MCELLFLSKVLPLLHNNAPGRVHPFSAEMFGCESAAVSELADDGERGVGSPLLVTERERDADAGNPGLLRSGIVDQDRPFADTTPIEMDLCDEPSPLMRVADKHARRGAAPALGDGNLLVDSGTHFLRGRCDPSRDRPGTCGQRFASRNDVVQATVGADK